MRKENRMNERQKRWILYWGIILSAVFLIGMVLYTWWLQIPGTIRIKAGVEETFDFHVPASGKCI